MVHKTYMREFVETRQLQGAGMIENTNSYFYYYFYILLC